jgi:hypothetical protein
VPQNHSWTDKRILFERIIWAAFPTWLIEKIIRLQPAPLDPKFTFHSGFCIEAEQARALDMVLPHFGHLACEPGAWTESGFQHLSHLVEKHIYYIIDLLARVAPHLS